MDATSDPAELSSRGRNTFWAMGATPHMNEFISPSGWICLVLLLFSSEGRVSPRMMGNRTSKWELVALGMYQAGEHRKDTTLAAVFCASAQMTNSGWDCGLVSLQQHWARQAVFFKPQAKHLGELAPSVPLLHHKGHHCGSRPI